MFWLRNAARLREEPKTAPCSPETMLQMLASECTDKSPVKIQDEVTVAVRDVKRMSALRQLKRLRAKVTAQCDAVVMHLYSVRNAPQDHLDACQSKRAELVDDVFALDMAIRELEQ